MKGSKRVILWGIEEDGVSLVKKIEFLDSGGFEHVMGTALELILLYLFDDMLALDDFVFEIGVVLVELFLDMWDFGLKE